MPKLEDFEPISNSQMGQNIAPNKRGAATSGISAGVDELQGLSYSGIAALADIVGADKAKAWLEEQVKRNEYEAFVAGRPDLERIEDQTLGSALPYAAYQIGKQIPNIAGGVITGALVPEVAVPAWLARGAAVAPRALGGGGMAGRVAAATAEGASTLGARRAAIEAGQTFGKQVVGGAAFNEAQAVGSLYQSASEDPTNTQPGLTALALSPAYALAETLPEASIAGRFAHGSGFGGNLLSRVGKNMAVSGASGATSELTQTGMEIGVGKPMSAEEKKSQYLNAGVAGGLVEGILGGFGGIRSNGKTLLAGANTAANSQTGQTATNEIQQAFQQNPTITPVGTTPGFDMAAQMSGTAGRVDPLTGRSSLVGTQAGTTPEFDMAAQMGGTADRVNPLAGRSSLVDQTAAPITAPAVTGGTTDIAQAQATAQQQNQQVNQAQKEQAAREDAFSKIGAVYNPEGQGSLQIFGQTILGPQVNTFGTALAAKVAALPDHAHEITNAIAQANTTLATKEKPSPLVSFTYNGNNPVGSADKAMQALAKTTDKFQIGHVDSVQMAAGNLNTLSVTAKGNQLEQINAIHEALTGRDTDGYIASQQTKGAKNGQTLQTTSGVGTVPIQSGTGEGSGTNVGDVRPSGVQSLLTGSEPQGQTGQQTGQPSGEGIRTGTSVTPDLSGGQPAARQINLTAPAPDTNQLLRQIFGDTYAIDETVPPATRGPATRATGQTGQVRVQPKQTGKPGISEPVSTGVAGERVVKRRYKWTPTNAPAAGTNQFYSTAVEHIHPTKRSEIILAVFVNALEPRTTRGDEYSANIRAQILQMSLMEQMTAPEISKYFAELETPIDLKPGTIDTQRKRMGLVDSRSVRGVYFDTTSKQGQTLAADIVQAAAEFKTDAFPDGIGPDQLRGFYAAKNSFATGDEVVELSNDVIEEPTTRNTDVKLQEEMYRSSSEGNAAQSMGEISTAGGSQGNVDSLKKTRKDQKTKETFKDISALDQIEKLTDEADQIRDSLDGMAPKDPRRAALVDRLEQIGDVDSGEIQGLYKDYNKAQKLRSKEAEEAGVAKEQEAETTPEELTGQELAASEREDERKAEAAAKAEADKGETNAVQVESTDEGNVRKPARSGKTVGEGNAKPEKPAKQTKQAKTEVAPEEVKTPEEQWNELRTLAPELPAYADLNKDQRIRFDDLANRGKANLAAVVNQIVTAPATEIATEKRQTISDVVAEAEKPAVEEQTEPVAEDQPKFGKNIDNETHNEEPYLKENGRTLDLIVNGKVTKTFELVSQGLWDAFKGRPEGQENLLRNKEPKEVIQQAQKELAKARSLHTEYAPLTRNEKLALQAVADKDMDTLRLYERSTSLRQSIFQIVIQATINPEGSFPSYVLTDAVANRNGDTKQASNLLKYAPSSMMKGVTMPAGLESAQFGKSTAPTKPYTAQSLIAELKAFMRVDSLGRNVIIVDDVAELEDMRDQAIGWSNDRAFGWTRGGKAILVASRIQEGQGRAKFMHEVGSHLGLDRMLAEKDIVSLAGQISKWADLNDNSKESTLARKAVERVGNANVADEDVMSELIAYFVEEAMQSGVDPSAAAKMTGAFGSWFRTLWAGFKNAVRKLGFKPESLTAQDVVNMAYGAARLEVAGTWHGTAAEFRKFNHQYMGTGEGAQAYGWGSYLAQRYGIGEGYRVADIRRKGVSAYQKELSKYIGFYAAQNIINPVTLEVIVAANDRILGTAALAKELHDVGVDYINVLDNKGVAHTINFATPAGSMMRVDVNMQDNETLNWDEKISDMPQEVQDNLAKIKDSLETEGLLEGYLDKLNIDWTDLTGADLYKTILKQAHEADAKIFHAIPGSDRMSAKKATSLLLDSLGIKGLKFLDARSRDKDEKQIMFNGKTYSREDLINMRKANGAPIPLDQIATLRHVLRHGVEETIKEYQAKVDKREKQLFDVYRESAERYKVPFNEAEELAKAKQQALNTYEAKQIAFLKSANVKVVGNKDVTRNLVVFNDANIFRAATNIGTDKEQVKFGINPAATVDETINRLPPFVRTPTRNLVTNLLHQAKNAVYASAITEDVVKLASKYMKSANDYLNAQYARQATRIEFEQRINSILSDFDKLSGEYKGTGANSVNKFIKDSTVSGKWGYYPGEHRVGTELFTVDPDMKLRFDAFGKDSDAQKVIKAVFEHGYEALMLKKKAVEAAIDREFADREKAVMGDAEQMKELAAEKKLLLAREAKVRGVDVSSPYAYLGRYGDYVVVAKSKEFKHYEERADPEKKDWDYELAKQWLQDNVSNSDHYVVQFAETQAEADNIAEKLHATGKYDITPEDAGVKEAEESYTGGGDIHLAVARLRNLVDRQVKKGDISLASANSLDKMVGDLYLMTVAETSARKSEMQRKNVSGADDNMMRNLATSGRADAHFLASLEHNDAITDSMERMRDEAKRNHREAMPIYNELIRRQANSMEYKSPGPLSVALTRMNTLWSLTFSPAFYLQQITQTAVISVPYLAGRIGYGNAVSQVSRGYKEIAGLIKGLGINEHIDFSKAPADVRDMLNKLVGMGKIDISMDSAERATADEKGVFAKVMYKMQGVNNRIESVNRSVAAIAAYRGYLEKYGNNNTEAATQYAAQVVSDTHGSYDGFNTPRALSNGIGRVVGQFRRFQIIQLSMLARLMHNSFKGASTEEKMVARKALGFIVAQMSVLGGAMAVPFMSQIAWMMSKILGDPDEPDDYEFKLRRMINNKVVSDLLLRGVPAALGVDVSDKLGMGRVASILPFAQGDLTSRSGAEKIIVAAMGPSASMGMKFADAFGMLLHGDYYKGLEMAMPNGVANVMKAGRFATEGITMRNGDLVLKPEDFGMVDAAFQAVGLPTNTVTDRQFTQNVKAEYDKFYHQKSTDIKGEYVNAYRAGDAQGMAKAREEFQRMEESRVSNGYKRLPMSELLKAPMAAMKRERGVIGGVETTKQNKGFVQLASQI